MIKTSQNVEEKSSYRSIFKATSLFGSVQFYQILIGLLKSKIIAVLLGTAGVGIQGLFVSATSMIQGFTSFGLSQSAVRNIAEADGKSDRTFISKIVTVLRRLVFLTGLLGLLSVVVLSPFLSKNTFGNYDYIIPFLLLSVTLLLDQISAGQKVILQGTRQLKSLAKCTTIGVTIGFFISIPLYYFLGIKAIVANIIIASVTSLVLSWYYSHKIEIEQVSISMKETFSVGKEMIIMGVALSLSAILVTVSAYILRICIRHWGGVEEVGLFTAGYMIMTQYTGLVFMSMSTDYYPRLSKINHDNVKARNLINQQAEVGMLLLNPLLVIFVAFVPLVVKILYTTAFMPICPYIIFCAAGMLFKMVSWSIAMLFIAKSESKLYMINESIASIYMLVLNIVGYYFWGVTGLGISYAISYMLYAVQVFIISRYKYDFSFSPSIIKLFLKLHFVLITSIALALTLSGFWLYTLESIVCVISIWISVKGMNKRINFMEVIQKKNGNK